jgi:NAD(P)H-flavin reductase
MGKTEKQYKHIGLIGAGSGITPLYGIMDEASKELTDQT